MSNDQMTVFITFVLYFSILAIGAACVWSLPVVQRGVLGLIIGGLALPACHYIARNILQ